MVRSADALKAIPLLLYRHIASFGVALFRRPVTEYRLSVHRIGKGLLRFLVPAWCYFVKCMGRPEMVTCGEELLL